ncbi:MAG: FAD-dependent thymidylate synthase [Bacilli bacterium]|nr:FAD-dependent thymidylate synthase [Bacilli bacterium]
MRVELLTTYNEKKISENLKTLFGKLKANVDDKKIDSFVNELKETFDSYITEEMVKYVASAARLSRSKGTVFDVINLCENKTFEENCKFVTMVANMGHDSITDHDYLLFALQDVSPLVEQTIIAERFSSFTIKSRREVNFKEVGYIVPNFRNKKGKILSNNELLKEEFSAYEKTLFDAYGYLVDNGISMEDARFVLPYSYYSNIIMGVDAHTLKDMIIKLTKTKYSNIAEFKQLGEKLYEIAKKRVPYIISSIDKFESTNIDCGEDYLNKKLLKSDKKYQVIDSVKLINSSVDVDGTILISAFMRIYQLDYNKAKELYNRLGKADAGFRLNLMRKIVLDSIEKNELTQVNFQFQIPISFAVLTHMTRHRTHHLLIPDFVPIIDLKQYKIPPKIKGDLAKYFKDLFNKNYEMYKKFKRAGVCEEDLVYFTLSGNMVNMVTNMNGKTLAHILKLRECTKAQWETRQIAIMMHKEIDKVAPILSMTLGATCETRGFCPEGKESCGRINTIKKDI